MVKTRRRPLVVLLVAAAAVAFLLVRPGTPAPSGSGSFSLSGVLERVAQLAEKDDDPDTLAVIVEFRPEQVNIAQLAVRLYQFDYIRKLRLSDGVLIPVSGGRGSWVYFLPYAGTSIQVIAEFKESPQAFVGCGLWEERTNRMLDAAYATRQVSCSNPHGFQPMPLL
ncbi:MAG TPA: hypothetical protein VMT30_07540 [Candidatus Saccharimonadia bacterium]|nr:hypothetical protein [Candidatus Saccharimonadia bacterium]